MEKTKSVIVKTYVKELLSNLNVRKEYYPALEKKVLALINDSKERAIANGRRSVLARDL